jgi:ATP-dependent RNA helicase DeaD
VQVLVLTPTRELAIQVCQAMRGFRIDGRPKVLAIYGGQSIDRQQEQLRRGTQIVVGTPGRVLDMLNRGSLNLKAWAGWCSTKPMKCSTWAFIQDVEKILSKAPATARQPFSPPPWLPPFAS